MSDGWKIAIGVVIALFLFPMIWRVISVMLGITMGLLQLAILAAIIVFIVGLVRRMNRV